MPNSAQEIWKAALGELQLHVSKPNYNTWLANTVGQRYDDSLFVIEVPTPFAAEWLQKRLYSLIKRTIVRLLGHDIEIEFSLIPSPTASPGPRNGSGISEGIQLPLSTLNPRYIFDQFIVGSCNRLAYAAALSVAEHPGHSYNPLFLYGGVGLGKTHLLHAIGQASTANNLQVIYVSAEQFTNEFITSIRTRRTEEFRSKYRNADVLLVDDIQFIGGKEQTEEGFFHTFNDLHNAGKQIALSSDRPPRSLRLLEDRLRSRFEWGLIADIQPPDFETRVAILQAKAQQFSLQLGQDVLLFIAKKIQTNIRELEGALNRVVALATLTRTSLTVDLAAKALEDITARDKSGLSIEPAVAIEYIARYFGLSPNDITGQGRSRDMARARQLVMYLLREEGGLSLAEIGKALGQRDHTTVLYGCGKMAEEINADPKLRRQFLEIREALCQQKSSPPA